MSTENPFCADNALISQLLTQLNDADAKGATKLPSRDIDMSTTPIQLDAAAQPHYIPPPPPLPLPLPLSSHPSSSSSSSSSRRQRGGETTDWMEQWYEDIKIPLLLAILYFLFQMGAVRTLLSTWVPSAFFEDGTYTVTGLTLLSALYGAVFYVGQKLRCRFV